MKAMILAAGRGERMRPLSDETPKPLLTAGGKSLVAHVLDQCVDAGVTDIVMNVCYKREQIMDELGTGSDYGVNIQYSLENELLGPAGGVIKALPLLGEEPFLMISGDIWSTYNLKDLIKQKPKLKLAHMVFVNNPDFHLEGDFFLSESGQVHEEGTPKLTYANLGIFDPKLFAGFELKNMGIRPVLAPAIKTNQVSGEHYQGPWMNLGTPAQLQQLDERLRRTA